MSTPEENKALVRRYFQQLEAGNVDVIDEVFAAAFTSGSDIVRSDV